MSTTGTTSGRGDSRLAQLVERARPVLPSARSTPLTVALLSLLLLAALFLAAEPGDTDGVVAWASTNLRNLTTHPVASMLSSIFVVPDGLFPELLLIAAAFAAFERRYGALRTAVLALSGHVLATVATEYGVRVAIQDHLLRASAAVRSDVGVSYAMYTVLAASVTLLPGRWRRLGMVAVIGSVLVPFAIAPGMTTTGHVLSVGTGLAAMHLARHRPWVRIPHLRTIPSVS